MHTRCVEDRTCTAGFACTIQVTGESLQAQTSLPQPAPTSPRLNAAICASCGEAGTDLAILVPVSSALGFISACITHALHFASCLPHFATRVYERPTVDCSASSATRSESRI